MKRKPLPRHLPPPPSHCTGYQQDSTARRRGNERQAADRSLDIKMADVDRCPRIQVNRVEVIELVRVVGHVQARTVGHTSTNALGTGRYGKHFRFSGRRVNQHECVSGSLDSNEHVVGSPCESVQIKSTSVRAEQPGLSQNLPAFAIDRPDRRSIEVSDVCRVQHTIGTELQPTFRVARHADVAQHCGLTTRQINRVHADGQSDEILTGSERDHPSTCGVPLQRTCAVEPIITLTNERNPCRLLVDGVKTPTAGDPVEARMRGASRDAQADTDNLSNKEPCHRKSSLFAGTVQCGLPVLGKDTPSRQSSR